MESAICSEHSIITTHYVAKIMNYHLSTTKNYFRSSATTWWNLLIKYLQTDCDYNSLVFSVKDFYLNTTNN